MINPNELRVANLVGCNGKYFRVSGIMNGQVYEGNERLICQELLTPIPLTTEILNKIGAFNEAIKHWIVGKNGLEFIKYEKSYNSFFWQRSEARYLEIKHLHNLQNIYFDLTGKELVINL